MRRFRRCRTDPTVASWKTELKAPLEEIFGGHAFAPVMARMQRDPRATILRSRVFIALHMHAGDGNVHTNLPVNSDDYAMLREANAAVARIMALARRLGGVISGEHGIGITKLEYLTAEELAPFAALQGEGRPGGAVQRAASSWPGADLAAAYTPSFSLIGHESLILEASASATSPTRSRTACAAASASPSARRTCRARTCSIRRATRSSPRRS